MRNSWISSALSVVSPFRRGTCDPSDVGQVRYLNGHALNLGPVSFLRSARCRRAQMLCGKLLLGLSLAVAASAQQRRAMVPSDILRVANVTDAQISPSGDLVVYTVSTVEGDATRSTLWLARTAFEGRPGPRTTPGETPADPQLVRPPTSLLLSGWNASTPRWSPDGKSIAFLADHESQSGIWIVTLERRQPRFIVPV